MMLSNPISNRSLSSGWNFLIVLLLTLGINGIIQAKAKPNIVLIMCDDMGWSDIGCYGGEVRTPHLDRLASEGLRFTQFYNSAKCTTTRAALLTGLYPRQKKGPLLKGSMVTLGEALQLAGYQTAMSGKWHLGATKPRRPVDRGFQEYYGLMDGGCHYFNPVKPDPDFKKNRIRVFGQNETIITEFSKDFYTTDAFTDHAVINIQRMAKSDAPYFMHVCYTAPHYPLHAPEEDVQKYLGKYKEGWENLRGVRHKKLVRLGLIDAGWKLPSADPEAGNWEDQKDKDWQDRRMAVYAAMIDRMDQGIGRILNAIEESGETDNTMILFLSDNGGCGETYSQDRSENVPGSSEHYMTCGPGWASAQNTPFRRFKSWMHEGGISTPLIVRWPDVIQPNTVTHQVGHIIDFMPTFLEAAQTDYPNVFKGNSIIPLEGKSLIPIFIGQQREGHKILWWEFIGNRAVREGNWKLVWDRKIQNWELYHMRHDRTEMVDLALQYPDKVRKMASSWNSWAINTGALSGQK
ncbi:arylsulfatase [Verrucomicrobia bacterium]|nr:arylsulfatase [Verrucomicrobiota bacterium]